MEYTTSNSVSPAECTDLNDPDFGRVSITGLVLGSVATYMCNPGYTLVGNMTRDCVQVDNTTSDWSDKAPVCNRTLHKYFIFISIVFFISAIFIDGFVHMILFKKRFKGCFKKKYGLKYVVLHIAFLY